MRKYLVEGLIKYYREDSFFLLTADIGFSLLEELKMIMGNDFINVGIAENNMIDIAATLSIKKRVVVVTLASFYAKCIEQIKINIDYHNANVLMIALGSNFYYGLQGYTHFATDEFFSLMGFPNINIYDPGTTFEIDFILKKFFENIGPRYIRIGRYLLDEKIAIYDGFSKIGNGDITIVSSGTIWFDYRFDFEIINCFDLKKAETVASLLKDKVVVVEELSYPGIIAGLIANKILENYKNIKFKAISCKLDHHFLGDESKMRSYYKLDHKNIKKIAEEL